MDKEHHPSCDKQKLLSIVLPIYNEEDCIRKTLRALYRALGPIRSQTEIIAVDDGSTDNTQRLLSELSQRNEDLRIVSHNRNLGKAEALRSGVSRSSGRYVAFFDADLQYTPRDLVRMFSYARSQPCDAVTGIRDRERYDSERLMISGAYNRLMRLIFRVPVTDCNAGIKILRRTAATEPDLFRYGLPLIVPYLHLRHYRVDAIPVELVDRMWGRSKFYDENRIFGGMRTIADLAKGLVGLLTLLLDSPRIRSTTRAGILEHEDSHSELAG